MNRDLPAVEARAAEVVRRLESGKSVAKRDRGLQKLYEQANSGELATVDTVAAPGGRYTVKPDTRTAR